MSTEKCRRRFFAVIFGILTVFSMSFIFYNSSLDATHSDTISKNLTAFILNLFASDKSVPALSVADVDKENGAQTASSDNEKASDNSESSDVAVKGNVSQKEINSANIYVRRLAHAAEFILLGFSICGFFEFVQKKRKLYFSALFALAFSMIYAVFDEYHQRFSDGRACELSDMATDTLGSIIGIAIFVLLYLAFSVCKRKYFSSSSMSQASANNQS